MSTDGLSNLNTVDKAHYKKPGVFFKIAYQAFERAEEVASGSVKLFYTIGGYNVCLRFAGSSLIPIITPALEHLTTLPCKSPALTICLWDSSSTGTIMPSLPWSKDDYNARGEVRCYNDSLNYASFNLGAGTLNMLNTEMNLALYWVRDSHHIPIYERGSPLLKILHWWMSDHGRQLIHAGAVGTAHGGVLLAGKGGSGKSNTALSCLNSRLLYLSDDYCLLSAEPVPYAFSIYNSGKLDIASMQRHPYLISAIHDSSSHDSEKALFFFHRHCPENITTGFPIRAIVLPKITGGEEPRFSMTSPMTALRALAPSTIFQLPGAESKALNIIADVVKKVPCYTLDVGPDLSKVPNIILDLLSSR